MSVHPPRAIEVSASVRDAMAPLVRASLGLVFPSGRLAGLERGIEGATRILGEERAEALLARVERGDREALDALTVELTVGETYFFRDETHFAFLRDVALRSLRNQLRVRMWSAGCATGEEAYSLAITAREELGADGCAGVEILATDLNPLFLDRARAGWYSEWSFRDVDPARRARWFTPDNRGWRVLPEIQKMVRFERLNLVAPDSLDWPRGVDVIFCRNVMIYFDHPTVALLAARFSDALDEAGWLIPGPSDPALPPSSGLSVSNPGLRVYTRAPVRVSSLPPPVRAPLQSFRYTAPPVRRPTPVPKPPTPPGVLDRARGMADANDLDGALRLLDEALRARGLDPALYLLRSTVRQAMGDDLGAAEDADRAVLLDRSLGFAHLLGASARARLGDLAAAQRGLRNARALLGGADDAPVPHGHGLTRRSALALCDSLERSLQALLKRSTNGR